MKKTDLLKRGAVAAVMAGLVFAAPVTAMAATVEENSAYPDLVKEWTVSNTSQFEGNQDAVFTFDLKYIRTDKAGDVTPIAPKYNNTAMTANQVIAGAGTVNVSDMELKTGENLVYTGSAELSDVFSGVTFEAPGRYVFELSEQNGGNNNISYDTTTKRIVYVDVVWADQNNPTGETKIQNVFVAGEDEVDGKTEKAESALFENGAKDVNTLSVEKQVAGTAANTQTEFKFTITISGISGSYTVDTGNARIESGVTDGKITADSTTGTATITAWLNDDDKIVISGLPEGATWKVTEVAGDYTPTYKINNAKDATPGSETTNQTLSASANSVVFTNEKGFVPSTGITMNTLPFIGVGVVAAAGAVTLVISRKRRAGEDF